MDYGHRILKKISFFLISTTFVLGCISTGFSVQPEPIDLVRSTIEQILNILGDTDLSKPEMKKEKEKRIMSAVQTRFDFREMSERTLATYWEKTAREEQEHFVKLFSELLKNTYIDRVEANYDAEIIYSNQIVKDDKALVYTLAVRNNKEVPLVYKLSHSNGEWMVYDVVIEGVSLIQNYRTQFSSVISKEKFEGLIKRMEEKVAKGEEAE